MCETCGCQKKKIEDTNKSIEIVEFISKLQLELEEKNQIEIEKQVKEKYGDLGEQVLSNINQEILQSVLPNESIIQSCECSQDVSKDTLQETKEKIKNIDIFLDDDLDDIAQEIICDSSGTQIFRDDVKAAICKYRDYTEDDIPKELIEQVEKKILFFGIEEGWLLDEYFV